MEIMFLDKTKDRMNQAFEKVRYTYQELPELKPGKEYGIYINIPFCKSKCSFCPFYKEICKEEDLSRYLPLVIKEIMDSPVSGTPGWIYIGGGTPNLLSVERLERLVETLKTKVRLNNLGMEVHPALLSVDYIQGMKNLGFSKMSMGVESLSSDVLKRTGRAEVSSGGIFKFINDALRKDIFVNIDMMVGLPGQTQNAFLEDLQLLSKSGTSQITINPFFTLRGMNKEAIFSDNHQFKLIEEAAEYLLQRGYERRGPWSFTLNTQQQYDSSKDELLTDFIGFGAASFSSCGKWSTVNPTYQKYARNIIKGKKLGLVAEKSKSTDNWRKFARMIADLQLQTFPEFPAYINILVRLMQLNGYGKSGVLSSKGIEFAHHLTKTVIESMPFPLNNPEKITNYKSYMSEVH